MKKNYTIKISIIVPVYNAEKYLSSCLDSIINQSYTYFELLLIDDGSTDDSGLICDEYAKKDNRIRVFHKQNGGVSSARNLGLDNAKEDWIAFCDSDDYVNPNWLEIYVSLISTNSVVDIACQGMLKTGLCVSSDYCKGFEYYGGAKEAIMLLKQSSLLGYIWNKIFKKSIIVNNSLRFDENITFMEDEEFILKYFRYCNFVACTERIGYNYVIFFSNINQKYGKIDNFYVSLSNFKSVRCIFKTEHNQIYQSYLNILTNSFFASYLFRVNDIKERLNLYRKAVGTGVFKVNGLSFISKLIFLLPLSLANELFLLKHKIMYR